MSQRTDNTKKIAGENIDFIITSAISNSAVSSKDISGTALNFTLNTVGRWSLEEKKSAVCMICKLSLKPEQKVTKCPMCESMFHQNHIVDWLRMKGKCPVCQQSLRPESLQRVKL